MPSPVRKCRCCCWFLAAFVGLAAPAVAQERQTSTDPEQPLVLDISRFYLQNDSEAHIILDLLSGRQVMDGVPFEIGGQARLYGQTFFNRNRQPLPESFRGIQIGRKFDDLYLIHHAMWPDVEGQPIAYIRLKYADGGEFIFAIRYGVQVSDWYLLPSYEKKTVSDPDTKICWSRPPVEYKAPVRLFETRLANPFPGKVVNSMDVSFRRSLSSYNLIAATVAQRPLKPAEGPRRVEKFDGALTIRVVDEATGEPILGALVMPGMNVEDEGVVAPPFYTSSTGEGTLRYPIKLTNNIWVTVTRDGYRPQSASWGGGLLWRSSIPRTHTFRLVPGGEEP